VVCDIHVGNIFGPRFVRKIVKRLNELAPTAVFISGDMFDGAVVDIQSAVKPWVSFRAPAGTYFVTGNHEEIRWSGRSTADSATVITARLASSRYQQRCRYGRAAFPRRHAVGNCCDSASSRAGRHVMNTIRPQAYL
jgi:predicted MPP superfamily phosphohydrolase